MRPWADELAAFGAGILPRPLTYLEHVGLRENLERVHLQKAGEILRGVLYAFSKGPLPAEYYDAQVLVPEDAQDLEFRENMARRVAAEKQKHGFLE